MHLAVVEFIHQRLPGPGALGSGDWLAGFVAHDGVAAPEDGLWTGRLQSFPQRQQAVGLLLNAFFR
jgi:hypothetical protein